MRPRLLFRWGLGPALCLIFVAGGASARAGLIDFITPGSSTGGGAINAEADFTLSSNSVTITLTNFFPSGIKPQHGEDRRDPQLLTPESSPTRLPPTTGA